MNLKLLDQKLRVFSSRMATPYVPVPIPIGSSSSSFTNRNQRSSSFGSVSTSSSSSKGQLEDSTVGSFKKMSVPDQIDSTSSACSSPLVRTKFTGMDTSIEYCTQPVEEIEQNTDSRSWEDRPSTPTILGYEVMEERAKFTVYKILVKRSPEESWVVFRRYTDFSRLNDKLKDMFPGFRLALPPKRWFKDNYNPDFLEDRQLGLQAFLQNLVAHKDIANCLAVREFLCLDDPPGPFDSLEESRAFCETLEETNYRLQKELLEKQREVESLKKLLNEKQLHIDAIERRISSDKENHEACWSGSLAENSVPEIEVAEVAYTADEEE
ncbi:PREDICTED: sorting nexin-16 isoform X2 [Aptenodytes forsteri]|uniref:sorting nexin-16 isoform X2 n=1 Tax=Aptenodytes forsteri TaxID=9233 RepID=UPI0004F42F9D|nr:PREDICTED: sorting nexin-16 isoform X2 [Aptenodytes forsteri]